MRLYFVLAFVLAARLFLPAAAWAQSDVMAPRMALDGIWDIKDENNDKYDALSLAISHQFVGLGHRTADTPLYGVGVIKWPKQPYWTPASGTPKREADGAVTMSFGQFGYCSCRTVDYTVRPTGDPDVMTGKWVYKNGDGAVIESGKSVWRRRPPIKIDTVTFYAGGAPEQEVRYGKGSLKIEQRYTRGDLWITIYGERLAGGHNLWMYPENGNLTIRDTKWLCANGDERDYGDEWRLCGSKKTLGDGVTAIRFAIRSRKQMDPGKRTIWLDGQPIEIDVSAPDQETMVRIDIDGLWQQTDFEDVRWRINQDEQNVGGLYYGPFERGRFYGRITDRQVTFDFMNSWQKSNDESLNRGTVQCDYVESEDRLHCKITRSERKSDYEFVLKRLNRRMLSKPKRLPESGVIPVIDAERNITKTIDDKNCNCDAITLGRVEFKKYTGMTGSWIGLDKIGIGERRRPTYKTTRLFSLGDEYDPLAAEDIAIPGMVYQDLTCFYFTYPKELAYTTEVGKDPICRTVVQINYPHSRMKGKGGRTSEWPLYGVRGWRTMQTHTKNFICIQTAEEYATIGPGTGSIRWTVRDRPCPGKRKLIFSEPE